MAEPGASADKAGGLAAPPPPQLPTQAETTDTNMHGAGVPEVPTAGQPPLQTEASDAGAQPPRAPSQERAAATEAENIPPAPAAPTEAPTASQLPLQAEASGAGAQPPRAPSQERAAAAEAKNMPPAPPAPTAGQPPLQAEASGAGAQPPGSPSQDRAAEAEASHRYKPPPAPIEAPTAGQPPLQAKASGAGAQPSGAPSQEQQHDGNVKDGESSAMTKPHPSRWPHLRDIVMKTLAWYRRHISREKVDKSVVEAAAQKDKIEETKPSASSTPQEKEETKSKGDKAEEITKQEPKEDKSKGDKAEEITKQEPKEDKSREKEPHPRWGWAKGRLEDILEEAFTRLVAGEFMKLDNEKTTQCLLTFSVFPLGEQVKKQAVTYWWATLPTQFGLQTEKGKGADYIFSMLSGKGFLEPIKNRCSGVIHGCRVNPLVHWTVKRLAREREFADLEGDGNPANEQPKSEVLCLTRGSRDRLQSLRKHDESQSKDRPKPPGTKKTPKKTAEVPPQDLPGKTSLEDKKDEKVEIIATEVLLKECEKKRVILNISAHVYRLPEPLLSKLFDRLEVLQLGRWWNLDDKTYMEVEALEYIGKLKNLRYLSLRGLSRMTELPNEFRKLRRLAILDVRGCQNLVKVSSSTITNLNRLTHLDLTECYMLEHIGRGVVAALPELEVFKGFVFGVGAGRRKACRVSDLVKLRKLRKLSINITTDATVGKDEMKQLEKLTGLLSLTVTWGEVPSILWGFKEEEDKRLQALLDGWTGFILPPKLEKLDVRCYPKATLPRVWFVDHDLKKLYVRGGDVEQLDIPKENKITTLRLRYLNKFEMKWDTLFGMLNPSHIKFVEVVDKDQKVVMNQTKGKGEKVDDEEIKKAGIDEKEHKPIYKSIKERMDVPKSTLDENGVWVRDAKENYDFLTTDKKGREGNQHHKAKDQPPAPCTEAKDEKKLKEDEKRRTSSAAAIDQTVGPASSKDVKKGAGADDGGTDKSSEPLKASQAPPMGPKEDATKTEAATGAADIPKVSDKGGEGDDDGRDGGAEAEDDEPANEEDRGNVREHKKFDGGDADKAPTEGEGEGEDKDEDEDEGQGRRHEVVDAVDEQPTAGEDGGDDDTSAPDASSSPAAKRPELKEEIPAKLIPAAKASASRTTTLPAPPAATGPAPAIVGEAAAEPKEPGKAGGDDGLGGTGATDTRSSTYA